MTSEDPYWGWGTSDSRLIAAAKSTEVDGKLAV